MRITFNAPVILSFTLLCVVVRLLGDGFTREFFTVRGTGSFSFSAPLDYFRLVSHIGGHGSWAHLTGNFKYILLIGPIVEEKYGSLNTLIMMVFTGLITGILNIALNSTGLLGASGIVFMFILLASITNLRAGHIPLTFILVFALYIGEELLQWFSSEMEGGNRISHFAHIIGGICGAVFGFSFVSTNSDPERNPAF